MKLPAVLLVLAVGCPALAADYRYLRAQFDDLIFRDNELPQDPDAVARRARFEKAEAQARAAAEVTSQQTLQGFESAQRAAEKANPTPKRREMIVGPGPDGRIVTGGPDVFHPNPATARPPAPAGFVWLFPTAPGDHRLARRDPEGVFRPQDRRRFELESVLRAKAAYPFLADKADPRRAQFDRFLQQHVPLPLFKTLFGLTRWPELAAEECARLNRW